VGHREIEKPAITNRELPGGRAGRFKISSADFNYSDVPVGGEAGACFGFSR
jgi:hypothetical protein